MKIPSPYHNKGIKIKAFVLGCDSTAFSKEEKLKIKEERKPIEFETVFGLDKGLKYFGGINANLKAIGVFYERDIYVQNLVTDYQKEETSENKSWDTVAAMYIEPRKKEFDALDSTGKIPVLLTSEHLYKVLLNENEIRKSAKQLYQADQIIIPASKNKLGRPLIVFYRHYKYSMKSKKDYCEKLRSYFAVPASQHSL